jgi:hypothetical protein
MRLNIPKAIPPLQALPECHDHRTPDENGTAKTPYLLKEMTSSRA